MVIHSPFNLDVPNVEFRQLLDESLKRHGDSPCWIDGLDNVQITFNEVSKDGSSIAVFLSQLGIGRGTNVVIIAEVSLEANKIIVGLLLCGATPCPVNCALTPEEISQLIQICESKLVYCESKYLGKLEQALQNRAKDHDVIIVTDVEHPSYFSISGMLNEDISQFRVHSVDQEEDIAYILFTSGTTGIPKGVMITSHSAVVTAYRLLHIASERMCCTSPLFWVSYISMLSTMALRGSTLLLPRKKYISGTSDVDMEHYLACIEKYKPDRWFTGPYTLFDLCNLPSARKYDQSSLQLVIVGGAHLLPVERRMLCDRLYNGRNILLNSYGATEVGVITQWREGCVPEHDSLLAASIGQLVPGASMKVVDADGNELGHGQVGEFVLKTVSIMKGYINKDLPRRYSKDDWYHTGDLGYYDEDGYLYYTSRLKEIMKYKGIQIAPAEIENIVLQHPGVAEVCVVGRPHHIDMERPAAFVVRKEATLTENELMEFVNERVMDAKKLRGGVFFIDTIPRNGVGKVLRINLVNRFKEMNDEF